MFLFSPFQLGSITLSNRVIMAPMTRSRAIGGLANDLMRQYYQSRAQAGLIISEGIAPSPSGLGYARIPGLFSDEQVAQLRPVTDAVHQAGGHIFAQLMHVGRIAHPLNMPLGARVVAPSQVRAQGVMWTDQEGALPFAEPEALNHEQLSAVREEFVHAAQNARRAGFDGVELHAANGYLLNQFLHPHTNRRLDEYGGNVEGRARFLVELAAATAQAIGAERVGVRLSPHGTFNDLPEETDVAEDYAHLAQGLSGIAYLHVIRNPHAQFAQTAQAIRSSFKGPLVLNGGFDRTSAEAALVEGQAELISFGRPFIANPDFVARMQRDVALASADPATFYTPGPQGYVDYATL